MKYLVANWKAHKTMNQVDAWLDALVQNDLSIIQNKGELIICSPYPFIPQVKRRLRAYPYCKIGSQDISCFDKGSYTGEVPASVLSPLVSYAIVGHSERRRYFRETEDVLFQKSALALQYKISPIFCVRGVEDRVPPHVRFVAYEPIDAIGTGNNESLEKVLKVKRTLQLNEKSVFIYGGSVTKDTISPYLVSPEIDGFLVGGASLDARIFFEMVQQIAL